MGVVGGAVDGAVDSGVLLFSFTIVASKVVCASVMLLLHSLKCDWKLRRLEEIVVVVLVSVSMVVSSLLF